MLSCKLSFARVQLDGEKSLESCWSTPPMLDFIMLAMANLVALLSLTMVNVISIPKECTLRASPKTILQSGLFFRYFDDALSKYLFTFYSQINRKVQEHHVNIIFAVTANQIHIYKQLTGNSNSSMSLIEGASSGELEQDSSNVVHLIENEYKKITSTIELKDNATSNVQITYTSSCLNGTKQTTNICSGLRVGDHVSFDITLVVESCPTSPSERNQTIKIYPVGLTDALYIDLSMICDCECEQPWNQEPNSPECGHNGVYQCGICNCYNNHYGRRCECDAKDSNPEAEEASCFKGNDTKVCSGRGTCRYVNRIVF